MIYVPQRKHAYMPPRLVTEIALILYINDIHTHKKVTYGSPGRVKGIALLVHV
jgi:hypothetical protein